MCWWFDWISLIVIAASCRVPKTDFHLPKTNADVPHTAVVVANQQRIPVLSTV